MATGKVIDLSIGFNNTTIGFNYVEQNYTALNAIVGTAIGELAYVQDAEGTQWLPGTIGGTYYPNGIYIWDGANWVSDRNAIAEQLDINIDDITNLENTKLDSVVGGTDISVDNTDPINPVINYDGKTTPTIKAGKVLAAAFSGNPKKTAAITFTTPFASAEYSLVLTAHTQNNTTFSMDYESRLAGSFVINSHANNITNLIDVTWIATELGEN